MRQSGLMQPEERLMSSKPEIYLRQASQPTHCLNLGFQAMSSTAPTSEYAGEEVRCRGERSSGDRALDDLLMGGAISCQCQCSSRYCPCDCAALLQMRTSRDQEITSSSSK